MVHRCRHSGNLKVFPTDQLTNLLTGVGARDTYASKKECAKTYIEL